MNPIENGSMTNNLSFGHLHNVYIAYQDDPTNGKTRPVLVIGVSGESVNVFQITSQAPRNKFQDNTRYKIIDWNAAGLTKESYVKLYPDDIRRVNRNDLTSYRGILSNRDITGIQKKLAQLPNSIK